MDEYPKDLFKGGEAKTCRNNGEEAQARLQGYTEPYKFQEYPKHLYKDGVRVVFDNNDKHVSGKDRIVKNKEEEDAARAEGFLLIGESVPKPADPALAHLPAEVLATVTASGKDSVVGKALLAQYPAPIAATASEPAAKPEKAKKAA
jgi:hypothetical protein